MDNVWLASALWVGRPPSSNMDLRHCTIHTHRLVVLADCRMVVAKCSYLTFHPDFLYKVAATLPRPLEMGQPLHCLLADGLLCDFSGAFAIDGYLMGTVRGHEHRSSLSRPRPTMIFVDIACRQVA